MGPFYVILKQIRRISEKVNSEIIAFFVELSLINQLMRIQNKIGHSSRSSSIQRSKTIADQRCLVITILENLAFQFLLKKDGLKTSRQIKRKEYKKKKI